MSGFEIKLDDGISQSLQQIITNMAHPAELFEGIGADLAAEVKMGFHEGRSPYGDTWDPPKFRAGQPLRDSGRLANSITYNADDSGVEVGTNVCYAATHQFGATIRATGNAGTNACGPRKGAPFLVFKIGDKKVFAKQVTIPARPFLPTPERGMPAAWLDLIRDRVARQMEVDG